LCNKALHIHHAVWTNIATCADKTALYNGCIIYFSKVFMSLDLIDMSNEVFDDWLRDVSGGTSRDDLSEERLVGLVATTLREASPEGRARGFLDLANLCHAMADRTLGSLFPSSKFLEIVVNVGKSH
jgi:hypothetical protein